MAKQRGFIQLDGSLGELTFFKKNGKNFVRLKGGVDKKRIETEANFKRTRENMREFGGSAKVGKALRFGYSQIIKSVSDSQVTGRLTGLFKRLNSAGSGERGARNFEIIANKALLTGFDFNKQRSLSRIFYPPYELPTADANRSVISWDIPDFNTSNFVRAPEGATHFKLILACTILSDYVYNTQQKSYEPVLVTENELHGIAYSDEIAIGGMVGGATNLSVDLGLANALPNTGGVVTALGILFYQEINGSFYELSSDNALQIVTVL